MYKNILVSIDLGHAYTEKRTIATAVDYAGTFGSTLHVMTVVPDYGMSIVGGFFPQEHEKQALEHANVLLHKFTAAHVPSDIRHRHIVGHGSIYRQILHYAEVVGADLIVAERLSVLFDVFGHKNHHANELPAIKPTLPEMLSGPNNLTFRLRGYDPDFRVFSYDEILDCTKEVAELEALHRWAMVPTTSTRGTGPRPNSPRSANSARTTTSWSSTPAVPRCGASSSGCPPARGAHPPCRRANPPTGPAVPAGARTDALPGDAPHRGAGRGPRRPGLHQRGPDPQRGLQLVTDVGGRDPRKNGDRAAGLHVGEP
jgi:hypothetical protein